MTAWLNHYGSLWLDYFGLAVAQNTLFMAIVLLALYSLRNRSVHIRYAVALIGLLKLLLPSIWRMPIDAATIKPFVTDIAGTTVTLLPLSSSTDSNVSNSNEPLTFAGILFAAWLLGAAFFLVSAMLRTYRMHRRLRGATPIGDHELIGLGMPSGITVMKSSSIALPMTHGIFPRKIHVPERWDLWSAECRNYFLRHELAHIRRGDGFVQLLQILARAAYFFHPLLPLLMRRLEEYREMACDEASVSSADSSAFDYSRHLVDAAEFALLNPACESASALIQRKGELLKRVSYLTKRGSVQMMTRKSFALVLGFLIVLSLALSWHLSPVHAGDPAIDSKHDTVPGMTKHTISIAKNGDLQFAGKTMPIEKLQLRLAKLAGADPNKVFIQIDCAEGVAMARVFELQEALLDNGLTQVEFAGVTRQALPLRLPSRDLEKKLVKISANDKARLVIDESGGLTFAGEKIDLKKLGEILQGRLADNPHLILVIEASAKVRYADCVHAIDACKKAGATRIALELPKQKP